MIVTKILTPIQHLTAAGEGRKYSNVRVTSDKTHTQHNCASTDYTLYEKVGPERLHPRLSLSDQGWLVWTYIFHVLLWSRELQIQDSFIKEYLNYTLNIYFVANYTIFITHS